jgi:ABC-type transport system involved in multi-copper enzyme maturation permease subunit
MSFAFLKETMRNTLSQPALMFVFILQIAILAFIAIGLSFEYHNDILVSISVLGKEPLERESLFVLRRIVTDFVQFGWTIFMFLFIVGTSASFSELFKDPLLNILLTKKYSRSQLLFSRYIGVVTSIFMLQLIFSMLLISILFVKTGQGFWWLILPITMTPVLYFLILASLNGLLSILFENVTAAIVISLSIYYFNSFLTAGTLSHNPMLKILSSLFPPFSLINRIFIEYILYGASDMAFPFYCFIYATCYLFAAIILFKRRDL